MAKVTFRIPAHVENIGSRSVLNMGIPHMEFQPKTKQGRSLGYELPITEDIAKALSVTLYHDVMVTITVQTTPVDDQEKGVEFIPNLSLPMPEENFKKTMDRVEGEEHHLDDADTNYSTRR
jgi:hypothetical protein